MTKVLKGQDLKCEKTVPQLSHSYSPSPSTKQKRRLTESETKPKKKTSHTDKMEGATGTNNNPPKQKKTLSPELEDLRSEVEEMITPLKESINILLEIKTAWELSLKDCNALRNQNYELNARITKVENENKQLNDRVQHLEDKLLECNVVFQGVPDSVWEPMETTREKILTAISHTISGESHEQKMEQARNIPIKEIYRTGKYTAMRSRPVIVEFCYRSDVSFLLVNKKHLPQGVFVDRQYTEETEKERRCLRPILRAARKNENYKGKCRMDGSTLVIKGRNYNLKNLHQLPLDINGYSATSKTDPDNKVIGFFGELNPLSNFHPASFSIHGRTYHSSEQFIQHQKSVFFGDKEAEHNILDSNSALECKKVARDINNYDHEKWKQNAKAMCTPGILAKFEQNPSLTKLLLSTGNMTLVESCKDRDWGTGVPLYENNALIRTSWHNQGF